MKQTLFRDGVIERLPQLIGEGASTYSVQSSVLENFRRVCKCLLGNSSMGVVMAGLNVSITPSQIGVGAGYGVTRGGDMIYLAQTWTLALSESFSDGDIVHVYLNYSEVERGDDTGGHSSWINRENVSMSIIKDGLGANASDQAWFPTSNPISQNKDSAGGIAMTDTKLYLGSGLYSGGAFVFTPTSVGNEHVEYVYSHQFTAQLWSTAGDTSYLADFINKSKVLLPQGRKRLKQINLLRLSRSTNVERTTASNLIILQLAGRQSGHGAALPAVDPISLRDTVSEYFYEMFTPSMVMGDDVAWLEVSAACTTPQFTTNADTNTNGVVVVEYIIEKLN